jgi:nicotinate-nucleotide adenylyltransferase
MTKQLPRVAIYSGTFDPIHIGHITFALQALQLPDIKELYFLPERSPIDKVGYEHFGHRVAMITRATKPYRNLKVLEIDDKQFSVNKTLPRLQSLFKGRQLVFLFGSDKVGGISHWPNADRFLKDSEIIIGTRKEDNVREIQKVIDSWAVKKADIVPSYAPEVASTTIRLSLNRGEAANGLLKSVAKYIRQNWLYVSLSQKL